MNPRSCQYDRFHVSRPLDKAKWMIQKPGSALTRNVAGRLHVFIIACQRLSKVNFFYRCQGKSIIRSYLEFAMIGRTCSRLHRGHVFIVEYSLLLCIHIYIYIYIYTYIYISWCHMLYMPACREDRLILLYISMLFFRSSCASLAFEG